MTVQLKMNKDFYNFMERLQEMGHDLDPTTVEFLEYLSQDVTLELFIGIDRHYFTGETVSSLIMQPKVEKIGDGKYSVKVGFELPKGLPASYINRGTKTNKKDPFINRALNKSRLKKQYQDYFEKVFNRKGGS